MNQALIKQQLELIYTDYVLKTAGLNAYNNIINNHASIINLLTEIGTQKGLLNNNILGLKIFDTTCITPDIIGSQLPNGDILGPFNTEINNYEKPYVPQSFGAIVSLGKTYLTYGIVDQLKAVLQYYGENELDNQGNTVLDYLIAHDETGQRIDFSDIDFRNDEFCLEAKIKGKYSGHAGTFAVGSASQQNTDVYDVSIKQPGTIENNQINLKDNATYTSTSRFKTRQKSVRPEYKKNHEPTKQEIETLIALKQGVTYSNNLGHELRLEIPERNPVDNFRNVLTLYENLEKPFIDYERNTPIKNYIFCNALGDAANMYYNLGMPARKVDYITINKYGIALLTPKIGWDLITKSLNLNDRYILTGQASGAIINGNPIINKINTPIPAGKTIINNQNGLITFGASRAYKLHKCTQPNCTCYGGYYKIDHKHKTLNP